ncbi:immunoglobulin superfamily member 11 [Platysternon megacephalum]|nr:immunoglobulin superfamily member 11 [Platysternon megacephalum]
MQGWKCWCSLRSSGPLLAQQVCTRWLLELAAMSPQVPAGQLPSGTESRCASWAHVTPCPRIGAVCQGLWPELKMLVMTHKALNGLPEGLTLPMLRWAPVIREGVAGGAFPRGVRSPWNLLSSSPPWGHAGEAEGGWAGAAHDGVSAVPG